jgi:formylglycine-generating enzyme required for sulfatase activity
LRKPGINLECGSPKKELNMQACNREFMRTALKHLSILPMLIAGLGLVLTGRVTAQPYTWGPEFTTTPSASITYTPGTDTFQYTDTANLSDDSAFLPLAGTAATFITTSHGWTASINANLTNRTMTATSQYSPSVAMGLAVIYTNVTHVYYVRIVLGQVNNTGGASADNPNGFYGTGVQFVARIDGNNQVTTPLGSSVLVDGDSELALIAATNASPVTESISAANGVLKLNYNASSTTVTGYYNGTPIGSYSLAGWAYPPLILCVVGASGEGIGVGADTDTATNFSLGLGVATAALPSGTNGVAYNQTLVAVGGRTPYSWTNISGSLPPGLTLATNGVISGTPTTNGTNKFTVKVTDALSATATQALALTVTVIAAQAQAPIITNITMVGATPQFEVLSTVGLTNQIQYSTNLSHTNWVVLTNLLVAQSPYRFVDAGAPPAPHRFYRVAALPAGTPPPSGMALIPAGTFTMGDTLDGESDAIPTSVYVSAFYMDINLVSYSQWQAVYTWATSHGYSFDNPGSGKAANHPVVTIDWYDCVKWCNARSQQAGRTPVYYTDAGMTQVYTTGEVTPYVNWSAQGYRLPTEAEWEKAARGGLSGQRFPWGNTISWSQANYGGDPLSLDPYGYAYDLATAIDYDPAFSDGDNGDYPYTSPVGSFAPNGYGLYDMAGNVDEWCWDWYGTPYAGGTDPRGPASGSYRVFRGGRWSSIAYFCRTAYRYSITPTSSYYNIGFRSVLPSGQ